MRPTIKPSLFFTGILCLLITTFTVLSAVEVAFGRDIPLLPSIQTTHINEFLTNLTGSDVKSLYQVDLSDTTSSRKLRELAVPKTETKLNLTKAVNQNGQWYVRPSQGHYAYLLNRRTQAVQYLVIYTTQDWRGIASTKSIGQGDNLFVETEQGDKHLFRIREKLTISPRDRYIPEAIDGVGLLLIVEQPKSQTLSIVRAEMLETQEVIR
jgi:hypothetical protein